MQREELLTKLQPIMDLKVRQVTHGAGTRVTATMERVAIRPGQGAHFIEFNDTGIQGMAKFIGISMDITKNLKPETFGAVATDLLNKKNQYALVMKDGIVNDVMKGGAHMVDAERALTTIERTVPGTDYNRVIVDGSKVDIEVVGERRQPVVRGDLIQAGALIRFSPVGEVLPTIQSYALRLACTNGATSHDIFREYKYTGGGGGGDNTGPSDSFWPWFRKAVHDAYGALAQIAAQYQRMLKDRVSPQDRATILEGMLRQAQISGSDAEAIRAMALQDPPQNSYDMMNLLSYSTSHLLESPKAIRKAREVIADYSSETEHDRVCPVCHNRRRARRQVIDVNPN